MTRLPDPQQPTTPAGQPTIDDNARKFLADLESAYTAQRTQIPTHYRDTTTVPAYGTTPPVTDQPGVRRAPMSQEAVDYSTRILSTGVASVLFSGGASLVMVASGYADPTVIGLIAGAPIAVAVPIAVLARLTRRAKEVVAAAPPEIHQHYSGHVYQDQRSTHVHTKNSGAIAITRNQLPELPPAH